MIIFLYLLNYCLKSGPDQICERQGCDNSCPRHWGNFYSTLQQVFLKLCKTMRQQIDCEEVNPILSAALHLLQVYLHQSEPLHLLQHLQGLLPHRALPYQTVAVQLSPQPRSLRALPAAVLPAGQQAAAAVVSSSLPLSSGRLLQQLHQEFPPLFQLGWFLPFIHLFCML